MTPRLHCPQAKGPGEAIELDAEQSRYVARVLRLRTGDPVELFDGAGARFSATIARVDRERVRVEIVAALPARPASPLAITLAQCVSSAQKMDWTIEKAVELGVAGIQPLLAKRSVVRLDAGRAARRDEHWRRLIVAACMQCGSDRLPDLAPATALEDWLGRRDSRRRGLVLSPGAPLGISRVAARCEAIDLLVGPESGLADEELRSAIAAGFEPVSIGPRILRTETAGLAAISVLQSRFGDL